ncbi:adenylate kinase [Gammaproteobacteria bacterium]|nr:adenylate kinase [Gammaproteobacteria bacterium]
MIILLMGAPGSGKGVQGQALIERLGLVRISTGDMLREQISQQSSLGVQAKEYMDQGLLVPDELIVALLKMRIKASDCQKGFILDGFPRTKSQAKALTDHGLLPDHIVFLDVPKELIIQRICGRLTHTASGRVYHEAFSPPKTEGMDDLTGEALVRRADDNEDSVRRRLAVFDRQTLPVVAYYQAHGEVAIHRVDGVGDPDTVRSRVLSLFH